MESADKEELNGRLDDIKHKRENAQDEYYSVKKRNAEVSDYIDNKYRMLNRKMDSRMVNSDPELSSIYEERKEVLKKWKSEEMDFQMQLENDWRKYNDRLDEEEREIMEEISRQESEEDSKEDKEDNK